MFSKMYDFLKRNRKSLAISAAVTGSIVLLGKIAEAKVKQMREREAQAMLEKSRKIHQFERTEVRAFNAVKSLSMMLGDLVEKNDSTPEILEQLKEKHGNKVELWCDLRDSLFAKASTQVLLEAHFNIVIRVQYHLAGAWLYRNARETRLSVREDEPILTGRVQDAFFNLCNEFVNQQLPVILSSLKLNSTEALQEVSLKDKVNLNQVRDLLSRTIHSYSDFTVSFKEWLTQCKDKLKTNNDFGVHEKDAFDLLVNDLTDILSSSDIAKLVEECISFKAREITKHTFSLIVQDFKHQNYQSNESNCLIPMAKVIPALKAVLATKTPSFEISRNITRLPVLSANVFEAFCFNR